MKVVIVTKDDEVVDTIKVDDFNLDKNFARAVLSSEIFEAIEVGYRIERRENEKV